MVFNMGQNNSVNKVRRRSLRSPFIGSKRKSSLSHTFSLPEDCSRIELININAASEEELMTLPGIGRDIARSIVKHRNHIGRFRKVEDLALVPGVGADKLDKFRSEICVRVTSSSCCSSRAQSVDSLKSVDARFPVKVVDVNKATVFELQCVQGMTQEMAANIVHYRNKKGHFKKLEDLVKVKSIDMLRFSNMRHHLILDDGEDSNLSRAASALEVQSNGLTNGLSNGTSTPTRHRKSSSAPVKLHVANGLPSPSSLDDIFDLLSAYSYRPIPEEDFRYRRNNKDAVRIATWNLDGFTYEKAQNLGVREVVCRTILENRWSIICVQDVIDEQALQLICDELNNPKLRKVQEFRGNSHEWCCSVLLDSHLAFVFDRSSGGLGTEMLSLKQSTEPQYTAALAEIEVGTTNVQLLNVDLAEGATMEAVAERIKESGVTNNNLVLLGNFTHLECVHGSKEVDAFEAVVPLHTNTACASTKCCYCDNILLSKGMASLSTGISNVVRQGLTHLAIPNGWSWGGPVSPHCPIWMEMFINVPNHNGF